MQIDGTRAMVVGGASGMARATAERLAAAGAEVAVVDRPGTAGAEVAEAIGGRFFECDITDFAGRGSHGGGGDGVTRRPRCRGQRRRGGIGKKTLEQ